MLTIEQVQALCSKTLVARECPIGLIAFDAKDVIASIRRVLDEPRRDHRLPNAPFVAQHAVKFLHALSPPPWE